MRGSICCHRTTEFWCEGQVVLWWDSSKIASFPRSDFVTHLRWRSSRTLLHADLMDSCHSRTRTGNPGKHLLSDTWGFIRERGLTLWVWGVCSESNPYFICIHLSSSKSYLRWDILKAPCCRANFVCINNLLMLCENFHSCLRTSLPKQ